MLGSSRAASEALSNRLAALYEDPTSAPLLGPAGTGVLTIADVADRERSLRQLWADSATVAAVKDGVLTQLFSERVPALSVDLVQGIINDRWSSERDMSDAIEMCAASLLFMAAESESRLDRVEEELFRFGRTVEANADLQLALTDPASSASAKQGIVSSLLDGKADPTTEELLVFVAGHLRGRQMTAAITELSELAAMRRSRVIANVTTAVPLTESQRARLVSVLSRIQGRDVIINAIVDPDVVGGIEVRVGDEVVDGTLATRIEQARRRLTS